MITVGETQASLLAVDPATGLVTPFGSSVIPVGMIIPYLDNADPLVIGGVEWNLMDGRAKNTVMYGDLFNLIGYSFGGVGPSFNIPNAQGRNIISTGQGPGLTNRNLGDEPGEETVQLTDGELANHNHGGATHGGVSDFGLAPGGVQIAAGPPDPPPGAYPIFTILAGGGGSPVPALQAGANWGGIAASHQHNLPGLGIDGDGGNQAHDNMQPSFAARMLLRVR